MTRILEIADVRFNRSTVLRLAGLFADEPGTCLLYSGATSSRSTHSFLCLFPYDFIHLRGGKQHRCGIENENRTPLDLINPWEALKQLLTPLDKEHPYPEWVGFLNYEMGAFSDPDKQLPYQPGEIPDGYFQRAAVVVVFDHATEKARLVIADHAPYMQNDRERYWISRFVTRDFWPAFIDRLEEHPGEVPSETGKPILDRVEPMESLESYTAKILHAKELIKSGDIYQVNLSQQFVFSGSCNPYQIFSRLAHLNPASFSAYFKLTDFAVVSSSPERLLSCQDGILETRPIKGTAPRGKTKEEDDRNRKQLLASEKERAELLMITDLMRNDLGRSSVPGTVKTDEMWGCEAYANVFHMVSTIRSKALAGLHPVDIVRSCFPGGSISGCPKLGAMEVIRLLENRPRGIYTGGIGYFAGNGDFDFNIAIRTLAIEKDKLTVRLGGAIVADSDPEKEYQETLHKGASIFEALGVDLG